MPVSFTKMNPVYNIHSHRTRHQISYERKLGNPASLTAKSPFVNLTIISQIPDRPSLPAQSRSVLPDMRCFRRITTPGLNDPLQPEPKRP